MRTDQDILDAAESLKSRISERPRIALILGSGLGDFASQLQNPLSIPSSEIPHYPSPSVRGHAGSLSFGRISRSGRTSAPLLVFRGRVHFYESGNLLPALFPVFLARALGAAVLIVTNAAGGINRVFSPGDLMLITDFLSLTFLGLPGSSSSTGNASPAMTDRFGLQRPPIPLDQELLSAFRTSAEEHGLLLREGTYCWVKGPSYETAAEIRMIERAGADAVGMSTVPEISLALQLGMRAAGISLISNLATGITDSRLSHDEVTEAGKRAAAKFSTLLCETLLRP